MTKPSIFYFQCLIILFPVYLLQYLQNSTEKIDNVQVDHQPYQVELHGSLYVFISAESGHDHLGIVYDEEREQKCSSNRQSRVCHLITHEALQESA